MDDKGFYAFAAFALLLAVAFWGTVAVVAFHFLAKFW